MSRLLRSLAFAAAASLGLVGTVVLAAPAAADDVLTVTNDLSSGGGSFAGRVAEANADADHDTIVFDLGLATSWTIVLTEAVDITQPLTIQGPGSTTVTIEGSGGHNLLEFLPIEADASLTINDLGFRGDGTDLGTALVANDDGGATPGAINIQRSMFQGLRSANQASALAVFEAASLTIGVTEFLDNDSTSAEGGAVQAAHDGSVAITDSYFGGNDSTNDGGAIAASGVASFSLSGSYLGGALVAQANSAGFRGGAVFVTNATGPVSVTGNIFESNQAALGGAVFVDEGGPVTISDVSFLTNSATGDPGAGGALGLDENEGAVVEDSTFFGNTAVRGGGLYIDDAELGTIAITRSTFSSNAIGAAQGIERGGAIFVDELDPIATLSIADSTFTGQTGNAQSETVEGLSLHVVELNGTLSIVNSTFDERGARPIDRTALSLAGVYGTATIAHSTIVGPGALWASDMSSEGSVVLTHDIVEVSGGAAYSVNKAGEVGTITSEWSLYSLAPLDGEVTLLSGNQLNVNPKLGPLQANGGPTQTRAPASDSTAINRGNPTVAGAPGTDQRGAGFPRVVQVIDIGAVEYQTLVLAATGSSVPVALIVGGAAALLLGLLALVFARVRRASGSTSS